MLLLATRNAGKVLELRRILADAGLAVDLVGMDEAPPFEPGPETGATFEANALAKAHEAARATGLLSIADDSGLCVDALNGMPGVLSARWAGRHGDDGGSRDGANNALLLGQVADVPDERRGARFVCAAAAATPDGRQALVTGEMRGRLLRSGRGGNGFGYDPLFLPDGQDVTSAELTAQAKDAISHRGKAFRALAPKLAELLIRRA